jgi:hypothetical protein
MVSNFNEDRWKGEWAMTDRKSGDRAQARPFIIWTLQRTGGTNLTSHLIRRSPFRSSQHEPFNRKREFGHITRRWMKGKNAQDLACEMEQICARNLCIKHCVEQVPLEVSRALAAASVKADYGQLFLYRRHGLRRLLSVEYARRTGVWGRGHLDKAEQDEIAFRKPLDVEQLAIHEERCNFLLSDVWKLLYRLGQKPCALAYEDIYETDDATALQNLRIGLDALGLSRGEKSDSRLVQQLRNRGHQGTRDRYSRFSGIDELDRRLEKVQQFQPERSANSLMQCIIRFATSIR